MSERMYSESRKNREEEDVTEDPTVTSQSETPNTDINDVLDEIDGVLEENAEEFVNNYVQKGGQ